MVREGSVGDIGAITRAFIYVSSEKTVASGGGTQTFDHNVGRNALVILPVVTDSVDNASDFDLSAVNTNVNTITVTNDGGATTVGVTVLAIFGDEQAVLEADPVAV